MDDWENYIQAVSDLFEKKEKYQRILGEISSKIVSTHGVEAIKSFATEVEETIGRPVSYKTLLSYRWVWDKTKDLDLPQDLTFKAYQEIAGSDNPKKWAEKIKKEGLSSKELILLIRTEKGLTNPLEKRKSVVCPNCGKLVEY